jgi:hypothetical protein
MMHHHPPIPYSTTQIQRSRVAHRTKFRFHTARTFTHDMSRNPNRLQRSYHEQREIDETLLSFRRHGEYEDPFKQWAKDTRMAAFVGVVCSAHERSSFVSPENCFKAV